MQTAYSYLRFSSPAQIKGDSRRRQLSLARKYAEGHGLYLDESLTFHDMGVSAYRGKNLETGRLGDFLRAVRQGYVKSDSYLLVESLDRISRDKARRALRVLEDICDEGITVVTILDNQIYTSERLDNDPTALLISLIIFIRANEESRTKARRQREAWSAKYERARQTGEIMTKRVPTWLRVKGGKIIPIPKHVKVVRTIYELAAMGIGKDAIAAKLNREKVPTFDRARLWHHTGIRELLTRPAVLGVFDSKTCAERKDESFKPIQGYYPQVIDKRLYNRVQKVLADRRAKWSTGSQLRQLKNVFSRAAKCPKCGSTMGRYYKSFFEQGLPSIPYFICRSAHAGGECDYVAVPYDAVEQEFRLQGPGLLDAYLAGELGHKGEIDRITFRMRVEDLREGLNNDWENPPLLNRKIRNVFSEMVIDYPENQLVFNWHCGITSTLSVELSERWMKRNRLNM